MVMVIMEVRICQMPCQLASRHWLCGHAGIYAGLVKGKRVEGREHADVWQDRDIVFTVAVTVWRNIHDQGNMEVRSAIYDSLGIFCHAAV